MSEETPEFIGDAEATDVAEVTEEPYFKFKAWCSRCTWVNWLPTQEAADEATAEHDLIHPEEIIPEIT